MRGGPWGNRRRPGRPRRSVGDSTRRRSAHRRGRSLRQPIKRQADRTSDDLGQPLTARDLVAAWLTHGRDAPKGDGLGDRESPQSRGRSRSPAAGCSVERRRTPCVPIFRSQCPTPSPSIRERPTLAPAHSVLAPFVFDARCAVDLTDHRDIEPAAPATTPRGRAAVPEWASRIVHRALRHSLEWRI
jgi:hypothetical protein